MMFKKTMKYENKHSTAFALYVSLTDMQLKQHWKLFGHKTFYSIYIISNWQLLFVLNYFIF